MLFHWVLFCSFFKWCNGSHIPRIAIIGGGVGGTTAAYELTQLGVKYGLDFELDLYESGEIGGRVATTFVNGYEFETGASIIHSRNKYMVDYAKTFNLQRKAHDRENRPDITGFYNGEKFVLLLKSSEVLDILKLWWRYGWDMVRIYRQLLDKLMRSFEHIYKLQLEEKHFGDVHSFLNALDPTFPQMLKQSIKDALLTDDYGQLFVNEFAFLATNINYNQNTDIHAFVGAVALAGAGETLWSVKGGNKKIPEALLEHSDAKLIKKRVVSIRLLQNLKYALNSGDKHTQIYDYVILACPLMENSQNKINFEGFPKPLPINVEYQRTLVTLVHGTLNHTFFGYKSPDDLPNNIFSLDNGLFFNSITSLDPVIPHKSYDGKVFKVFSKDVLSPEQLNLIFLTHDKVVVVDWLAYPKYNSNGKNISFMIHDNLLYTNAIEWAASAMEMSALSGKNIALLVLKRLKGSHDKNVQ